MEESVELLFCSWCLLCASLCFPVIQTEPVQAIFCCFNNWPVLCDIRCLEGRWWEDKKEICSFRSRYPRLNRLSYTTATQLVLVSQRCSRILKSGKGSPGEKNQNKFCFQCKIFGSVQGRYNVIIHLVIQRGRRKSWVFSILITSSSLMRPKNCHRKLLWKSLSYQHKWDKLRL